MTTYGFQYHFEWTTAMPDIIDHNGKWIEATVRPQTIEARR